ncbi:hypothetical protein C0992_008369, partial [Termitomyces sp. T32_za158]
SIAAAVQALIGNVASGSLFALLQSIAMGGAVPAVFSFIGGVIAGSVSYVITKLVEFLKWICE